MIVSRKEFQVRVSNVEGKKKSVKENVKTGWPKSDPLCGMCGKPAEKSLCLHLI